MSFLKKLFDYKSSLNVKVLVSMLVTLLIIIFFMEMSNLYIIDIYQRRAETTYQNSLKLYSEHWNGTFDVINNSLITLVSATTDNSYNNICHTDDQLILETSKVLLVKRLVEFARVNKQFGAFIYVPQRDIYLESYKNLGGYEDGKNISNEIKKYIEETHIKNDRIWDWIEINNKSYFVKVYHMQKGYVGAIIECQSILKYLLDDDSLVGAAAIIDENDKVVYQLAKGINFDNTSPSAFSENLELTNYRIGMIPSEKTLYSDRILIALIIISFFIIGIIIVLINMRVQMKIVLNPLGKLKEAMEKFSSGDIDIRLQEDSSSNEIKTLYRTFNFMAEQITNLKIDVYESELEKQEIKSNFLRIQIQPHFYTNLLNLIYGLAEIADFKSIQRICIITSNYFRYILNSNNTFVSLDKEIDCIRNYTEIQSMRYPGFLKFSIESAVNASDYMVPPLILQTFVENSIKHNITYVPMLYVSVDIREENEKLILNISDNGLGFSKDLMKRLNEDENIAEDGKHIGIVNVKQRLRLIYGTKAHVLISSNESKTVVTIEIPMTRTKGE